MNKELERKLKELREDSVEWVSYLNHVRQSDHEAYCDLLEWDMRIESEKRGWKLRCAGILLTVAACTAVGVVIVWLLVPRGVRILSSFGDVSFPIWLEWIFILIFGLPSLAAFIFLAVIIGYGLLHTTISAGVTPWLKAMSYWIPRRHREAIVGDILEDCKEMRELGMSEWRICAHVIWQLLLAFVMLFPATILNGIFGMEAKPK